MAVHVSRTFTVDRPVEAVVAYLADFANAAEWDPGTQRCTRVGDGPIAPGATWKNVSKILGRETELEYVLRTMEPGHLIFQGSNSGSTATDDITVRSAGARSEVTYDATVELKGVGVLFTPVMKLVMERLGDGTVKGITAAVGRLPV